MIELLELALSITALVLLGGPYLGAYALANVGDYFARRRYGLVRRTR